MHRLRGKRALITGGSSGIGLETAKQFVSEGASVAIAGRNLESLRSAKNELGDSTIYIESDAADASNQRYVAETVKKELGNLDILFVNAGVAELKPFEQWDEAAYVRRLHRIIMIDSEAPC